MPQPQCRIAVVTPYYREPLAVLARGHHSVLAQGIPVDHFMIADGHPIDAIDGWAVRHVKLPRAHGDVGSTPRGIGSMLAAREGYDFIAYLDADNWYHDRHLRSLLALWEDRRSAACASFRTFHDEVGRDLRIREHDEDELRHIDTSCFLLHRSGYDALPVWTAMPKILGAMGDRVFMAGLRHRGLAISSSRERTVAFRTQYRFHYEAAGLPVPEGAKGLDCLEPALDYLRSAAGVSACVEQLGYWPLSYLRM